MTRAAVSSSLLHALLHLLDVGVEPRLLLGREQSADFAALLLHQGLHLVVAGLRALDSGARGHGVATLTSFLRRLHVRLDRLAKRLELRAVLLVDHFHLIALRLRQIDSAEHPLHSGLAHRLTALAPGAIAAAELALTAR